MSETESRNGHELRSGCHQVVEARAVESRARQLRRHAPLALAAAVAALALALAGLREIDVYRKRVATQSCSTDLDCSRPQQCIDGTCCLPARSSSRQCLPLAADEVRWHVILR